MIPTGARVTKRTMTLPREIVDELFRRAIEPHKLFHYEEPYDSVAHRILSISYEGSVYGVLIELDGSKAVVDWYWGNSQLMVTGDNVATPEQLSALVARWKVGA